MSTEALKNQARRYEQREEWDKALEAYAKVIRKQEGAEDPDIAIHNRVGDLQVRLGNVDEAVASYETAIELYLDAGLPNNAVAVCRKVIRNDPTRAEAFLRLGRMRAEQGFVVDARENFLGYAELMQGRGKSDEAFGALEEFVQLAPEDVETRLFVAEQLATREKEEEALSHFSVAYGVLAGKGEDDRAAGVLERIHAIDPDHPVPDPAAVQSAFAASDEGDGGLTGFESTAIGGKEEAAAVPEAAPDEESEEEADQDFDFSDIALGADEAGDAESGDAEPEDDALEAAEPLPTFGLDESDEGEEEPAAEPLPSLDIEDDAPEAEVGAADDDSEGATEFEDFDLEMPDGGGEVASDPALSDEPQTAETAPEAAMEEAAADDSTLDDLTFEDTGAGLGTDLELDEDEDEEEDEDLEPLPTFDEDEAPGDGLTLDEAGDEPASAPEPADELTFEDLGDAAADSTEEPSDDPTLGETDTAPAPDLGDFGVERSGTDDDEPLPRIEIEGPDDPVGMEGPTPEPVSADDVPTLRKRVEADPKDGEGWRRLGAALAAAGEQGEAREAFQRAHPLLADGGKHREAIEAVRQLLTSDPDQIELHRRVVEYAHETDERALLVTAFLELAEALARTGERQKADAVFERVLSLDSGNARARQSLGRVAGPATTGGSAATPGGDGDGDRDGDEEDDEYVDLGSLVMDQGEEASTRWVVVADAPTGDEQADFAKMLSQFKDKVSQNLSKDDQKAHYDLGTAYKEMGLLDEAIGEFQQALKARPDDLATVEMLGHCFLEQGEAQAAIRTLERGLDLSVSVEDEFLGVYYFLGRSYEQVGNTESAKEFYEKIFALDINFEDVTERLRTLR